MDQLFGDRRYPIRQQCRQKIGSDLCRVSGADIDLLQYRNFKLVGVGIMPGNIIVTQIFK